jgi:L-histidine N-alpha-methyltransferase
MAGNATAERQRPNGAAVQIDVHHKSGSLTSLAEDVRKGLSASLKQLPPKYFYDERGSRLFELITKLPEYYPSRAEQAILDDLGEEIVAAVEPEELVELGPGSARKTHALIDPMVAAGGAVTYVPVDVSASAVREAVSRLAGTYDSLHVHGVVADFEDDLQRLEHNGSRRLIAFLGGTIGNLDRGERRRFLKRMRGLLDLEDRLLIGTDLVKDTATLEAAYNDSAGVTAEFNRNVLHVINTRLGANFKPARFRHLAFYDRAAKRIEMRLRAREAHDVNIRALDMQVHLERNEDIRTEISCKFTQAGLKRELVAAGLELLSWYTDEQGLFALSLIGRS